MTKNEIIQRLEMSMQDIETLIENNVNEQTKFALQNAHVSMAFAKRMLNSGVNAQVVDALEYLETCPQQQFKSGDQVLMLVTGTVDVCSKNRDYGLYIDFPHGTESFTHDGKKFNNENNPIILNLTEYEQ